MAKKRRKGNELRTSIRLPGEVADQVEVLEEQTGWSPPEAIAFLVRAGFEAIYRADGDGLAALRRLLDATTQARYFLRAEVRKLEHGLMQGSPELAQSLKHFRTSAAAQAKRAKHELIPEQPPKRKPGRPRKNPQPETEHGPKTPQNAPEKPGEPGAP